MVKNNPNIQKKTMTEPQTPKELLEDFLKVFNPLTEWLDSHGLTDSDFKLHFINGRWSCAIHVTAFENYLNKDTNPETK